jgi:hypothetical protein
MTHAAPRRYASTTCPYCSASLDPVPKAKKLCSTCRQPIHVRTGPDGYVYLLQTGDLPALEAAWGEWREAQDQERAARIRRQAAENAARSLREFRVAGIRALELLVAVDACPTCRAWSGRRLSLDGAPELPVPGCTREYCRCDYLPIVD